MKLEIKNYQRKRVGYALNVLFLIVSVLFLSACTNSSTANMRNLDSGESFQVTFVEEGDGQGRFEAFRPNGEQVVGDYVVEIRSMSEMSVRNRMAAMEGYDELSWASELGFSLQQSGKSFALATMSTDEVSVDLVIAFDPMTDKGEGIGKGSNGAAYKIYF